MTYILCAKVPGGFRAIDEDGEKLLTQIKNESLVMINVSQPRNLKLLAKYNILLNLLFSNQDVWPTRDLFKQKILQQLGYSDLVLTGQEEFIMVAKSLKTMPNDELGRLFDDTCILARRDIMPGISSATILAEIELTMGDRK